MYQFQICLLFELTAHIDMLYNNDSNTVSVVLIPNLRPCRIGPFFDDNPQSSATITYRHSYICHIRPFPAESRFCGMYH